MANPLPTTVRRCPGATRRLPALAGGAALLALALTGCASGEADGSPVAGLQDPRVDESAGDGASGARSDAAAFAACLTDEGVPARVEYEFVMVEKAATTQGEDGSVRFETSAGPDDEPALFMSADEDGFWAAPSSARFFESGTVEEYAWLACEAALPGFEQPTNVLEELLGREEHGAMADSALELAQCARSAGWSEVADPDPDNPFALKLPHLSEQQFRDLVAACPLDSLGLVLEFPARPPFDVQAVVEEIAPGASMGFSWSEEP